MLRIAEGLGPDLDALSRRCARSSASPILARPELSHFGRRCPICPTAVANSCRPCIAATTSARRLSSHAPLMKSMKSGIRARGHSPCRRRAPRPARTAARRDVLLRGQRQDPLRRVPREAASCSTASSPRYGGSSAGRRPVGHVEARRLGVGLADHERHSAVGIGLQVADQEDAELRELERVDVGRPLDEVWGLSVIVMPICFAVCWRLRRTGSTHVSLFGYGTSTENPLGVADCRELGLGLARC